MTVAELIVALSKLPQDLPVLVTWEGTLNAVEDATVDLAVRIRQHGHDGERITVGAVVIDGEHRVSRAD